MIQSCLRNQCQELLKALQHRNHLSVMATVKSHINPLTVCGFVKWVGDNALISLSSIYENLKAVFIILISIISSCLCILLGFQDLWLVSSKIQNPEFCLKTTVLLFYHWERNWFDQFWGHTCIWTKYCFVVFDIPNVLKVVLFTSTADLFRLLFLISAVI